jgi:hypothetical protein
MQRYPTAGALAEALRFAVTGLPPEHSLARYGARATIVSPITSPGLEATLTSSPSASSSVGSGGAARLPINRWSIMGGVAGALAIGALAIRMVIAPSAGETSSTGAAVLPTMPSASTPTTIAIVPVAPVTDAGAPPEEPGFVEAAVEPEPDVPVVEVSVEEPVPIAAPIPAPPPPPTPRPTDTPRPAPTATTPPPPTPTPEPPPPPVQAPPAPAASSGGELVVPMGESGESSGAPVQPAVVPAAPPTRDPAPGVPVLQMGAPAPTPAR